MEICKMCTKHLQVGTCLFKVVCLIEVSSKFIQEKTKVFIVLLCIFLQHLRFLCWCKLRSRESLYRLIIVRWGFNFLSFSSYSLFSETDLCPKMIFNPCRHKSCIIIKINLNIYFRTSLWCLKMFYGGL